MQIDSSMEISTSHWDKKHESGFRGAPPNKAWKEQRKFQGLSGLGTHKRGVCKRTCLDRCVTDVQKEL